jgi:xylan 1,4-beta-xylosidase
MQLSPQNAYRNGTMYSSYTAASFARIYDLADQTGVNIEGAVSWSFEFENQRWFDGFRDLATNGIDKPVLNIFRMLGMMSGNRISVSSDTNIPLDTLRTNGVHDISADINAFASIDKHTAGILLWNYHDDDLPAAATIISLQLASVPVKKVLVQHYRIDSEHSNSYELWKKMGNPQEPSAAQYLHLEAAGQLQLIDSPGWVNVNDGKLVLKFSLPRQAVSFIRLSWQ